MPAVLSFAYWVLIAFFFSYVADSLYKAVFKSLLSVTYEVNI